MKANIIIRELQVLLVALVSATACTMDDQNVLRGTVTSQDGNHLEGAFVAAHAVGKTHTTYVMTDDNGKFQFNELSPGRYTVFTRIRGFKEARKQDVEIAAENLPELNFQVEVETDFHQLIKQASNAELTESFPLSAEQRHALDSRCGECHGARYLAKSRFSREDWALLIEKMDDQNWITPSADIVPPPRKARAETRTLRPPGGDDESIADLLAEFRGPDSPEFPIKFQPRPMGEDTRAVITEYHIPRLGAAPRDLLVDSQRGAVWYTDWRANYLGRIDIETGDIKEYPVPGVEFRPAGLQELRFDPDGNILAAQIWAGRIIRFNPMGEEVTGIWSAPLEWSRVGSVGICREGPDSPFRYLIAEDLERVRGWIVDPRTDQLTEISIEWESGETGQNCDRRRSNNNWEYRRGDGLHGGAVIYRDPESGETTSFTPLTPWAAPDNAIGDPARNIGWSVPFVGENVIKADLKTGEVTEFPLPNYGERIHQLDLNLASDPASLWFVNLRLGKIVRFQEYIK